MAKPTRRATDKPKTTTTKIQQKPLTPFVKPPSVLQPFLDSLSPQDVYLIHIDSHLPRFKKQLFIVPVLLNFAISLVLAFRIYHGAFVYPALFAAVLGYKTSMSVDVSALSWGEFIRIILRRTMIFTVDYLLFTLFLPWPIRFIRGPVHWRWKIGFRAREIVVRRSRRTWSEKLARNRWIYEDEATVREKVVPAVAPQRLQKSGFVLVDADWDLEYAAMVRAHELVDLTRRGEGIQLDEFRTAVLVHTDDDGWLIWRVEDEEKKEGRDKLLAFRRKLASIGKEDLFFRWVELIQFESTQPGGFTPERQRKAMREAKQLFEAEGVDFAQFWRDVGGMEGNLIDLD
ncbi:hypothetical protein VTN49DRAFT_5328 [Thermomyces lanuginosus]|uniref:uncharacterized protein n=1 Tax=Thermomyces lanuginosus TaxID=5541 RepID=UPI0037439DD8